VTAAQIRDAARLVGADATAENVLDRTDQVAEIWVAGFIAGLEAANQKRAIDRDGEFIVIKRVERMLAEARAAAETVGKP
jgi:uncharacterized protein YgfB (UPF0149 family)